MNKILLEDKEFEFNLTSLPILIHGEEGSGASLYTICLAAHYFSQGYKILFLCGYSRAEEEFTEQVGSKHDTAVFYTKDYVENFKQALSVLSHDRTVVVIKNAELFDHTIFDLVENIKNVIISGDMAQVAPLNKKYNSNIFFSPLAGQDLPPLQRYEAFLVSENDSGITKLHAS